MAQKETKGAVKVGKVVSTLKHPIKASTLLYSAPKFILRGPIYLVFIITFSSLIYSFVAKKDMLVVAPLKLQREASTIQAVGGGMILDVATEENALIKAGDPIIKIQEQIRTVSSPEQESIKSDIRKYEDDLKKIRDDADFAISQKQLDLKNFDENRQTKKRNLDAKIKQISIQLQEAQRSLKSLKGKLKQAKSRLKTSKELYETRDITAIEYEAQEMKVSDLQIAVDDMKGKIEQIKLNLQTAKQQRKNLDSKHYKDQIVAELKKLRENKARDMRDIRKRIAGLKGKLNDANSLVRGVSYKENTAYYHATFDGIVTDIHVKAGEIITSGQPLITIVKSSAALEGQTYVQNKDIGNLKHGQDVKIKFFAYPYQEYGIQKGVISEIATRPGGIEGKESMYVVKVALDRETISKRGGAEKDLEIGLEGLAEIKTGEKRLIELVFAPVSKFFNNPEQEEEKQE
jgi:multidrug resistance efflux pump